MKTKNTDSKIKVLLLITGSIAAVRIPLLVSQLVKENYEIKCVLSKNAEKLIKPLSLSILSRNPCILENDQWSNIQSTPLHIELSNWADILIIAYGSMVSSAIETAKILKGMNINACIVNARFVKPLDKNLIIPLASRIQKVVTMEEGTLVGGFGSAIVELLNDNEVNIPVFRIGIPDVLVDHASPDQSKEKLGLKPDQMADKIVKKFKLDN